MQILLVGFFWIFVQGFGTGGIALFHSRKHFLFQAWSNTWICCCIRFDYSWLASSSHSTCRRYSCETFVGIIQNWWGTPRLEEGTHLLDWELQLGFQHVAFLLSPAGFCSMLSFWDLHLSLSCGWDWRGYASCEILWLRQTSSEHQSNSMDAISVSQRWGECVHFRFLGYCRIENIGASLHWILWCFQLGQWVPHSVAMH